MNIFLNEYFGFCFELNFELNHFWAKFNEKMNFLNVSARANNMRCSMRGQYEMGEFGAIKTRKLTVQKWQRREIEH